MRAIVAKVSLIFVFCSFLVGPASANDIAGTPCSVRQLNSVVILGEYRYTCILWQNKFIWSKGNKISLIQPQRSPSASPTPTTSTNAGWSQISPLVIKGTASPGQVLTVEGGEWRGPSTPKISYYWHHCRSGQSRDISSGYSAAPVYFQGMTKVNLRPTMFCGGPPGITTGTSYTVPNDLGITNFITVSQFVWTEPRFVGFGYYSYAKGVPVTTNGVLGSAPKVNAYSLRICASSCGNELRSGYPTRLDSKVGQWFDPTKSVGNQLISPVRSWYLCSTEDANWMPNLPTNCSLSPRSTPSDYYELSRDDSGQHIRLCATASNSVGTTSQCSPTYKVILPVEVIELPKLQGLNRVGSTLTISRGIWFGSPQPSVFVGWYSCESNVQFATSVTSPRVSYERLDSRYTSFENRSPFPGCLFRQLGKESLSYTVKSEDAQRIITVLITASNGLDLPNGAYLSYFLSMNQPSN